MNILTEVLIRVYEDINKADSIFFWLNIYMYELVLFIFLIEFINLSLLKGAKPFVLLYSTK